jgi:hypothetical protein
LPQAVREPAAGSSAFVFLEEVVMREAAETLQVDQLRIKYGFLVVVIGLAVVTAIGVAAIAKWSAAADVTAVVGSVTGVVGTIVGAFFGVQVGSTGKEKAEAQRNVAEDKALQLASALPPNIAASVLSRFEK